MQFIILLLVAGLASGCTAIRLINSTKLKEPEFKYVDYRPGKATVTSIPVFLKFKAINPNEIGLKNVYVSYELYTEGKRFLKGSDIEIHLAPKGETDIVIPAEVVYKDMFRALGPVATKVVMREKTIPVNVQVKIYGLPTVYNEIEEGGLFQFNMTIGKTIDVPVPHDQIDKAANTAIKKIKKSKELKKLKKLF